MGVRTGATRVAGAVLALAAAGSALAAALPRHWVAHDLGTLGDYPVVARGLDDQGRVVGVSRRTDTVYVHGFATGANGVGLVDLCGGADWGCDAQGINNAGEVVGGYLSDDMGTWSAFAVEADATSFRMLPTLGGMGYTLAHGVNDHGQVAGESRTAAPDGAVHAFASTPNGARLHDVGAHGFKGGDSAAIAINGDGVVVGVGVTPQGQWHAISAPDPRGRLLDLGTLGGEGSAATGVAPDGRVVGWADRPDGTWRAFIVPAAGGPLQAFGTLGGSSSEAAAINAHGHIVGRATTRQDAEWRATIIDAAVGRTIDLTPRTSALPAGVTLVAAQAINRRDQVAASGSDGHAYLLTPVR